MKDKIIIFIFSFILISFFLLGIFIPDTKVSYEERRKMAQVPVLTMSGIMDKTFFNKLDDYLTDQFPFRNTFRKIKGFVSINLFSSKINNGAYVKEGNIFEINASVDYKSLDNLSNVINKLNDTYFKNNNKYFSLIYDKNYFLDNEVKIDYNSLEKYLLDKLKEVNYIDINKNIKLDDFYKTDIHIRQDKLSDVISTLEKGMNLENSTSYEIKKVGSFYGALYSRINSNLNKDDIYILENDVTKNALVYNYEKKKYTTMYNLEYLDNIDSYDVFLDGASPLLFITNKLNDSGKELIVFRDSFGSSIVPLLVHNYSKITVLDLRYLASSMIPSIEELKFNEEADVLYIYSTSIANQSFTIK